MAGNETLASAPTAPLGAVSAVVEDVQRHPSALAGLTGKKGVTVLDGYEETILGLSAKGSFRGHRYLKVQEKADLEGELHRVQARLESVAAGVTWLRFDSVSLRQESSGVPLLV